MLARAGVGGGGDRKKPGETRQETDATCWPKGETEEEKRNCHVQARVFEEMLQIQVFHSCSQNRHFYSENMSNEFCFYFYIFHVLKITTNPIMKEGRLLPDSPTAHRNTFKTILSNIGDYTERTEKYPENILQLIWQSQLGDHFLG